ncbi:hypothetical protein NO1_0537 [Candidatus Termititenax aidoneus]|uniref:Uncharacterized protein n=1 Tax=Termititenax aidoneus TaxID=2218524 RepID=A0A388T8Z9_TERA1|nr:hypothetical protein NO1_0537 [Candidatus Termititenax aidoneus]
MPPENKELLIKITGAGLIALILAAACLTLALNCARLHYANLHLRGETAKMRQEPLLQKYPDAPAPPEYLELETIRALGARQGLNFSSSKNGAAGLEIIFTGNYGAFLDFLRALAGENIGEITQIQITPQEQKIIIQGAKDEK